MSGLTAKTMQFPWIASLLGSIVRGAALRQQFTTISLHRNLFMQPHLDSGNQPGTRSIIIPCGRWQAGKLWISNTCNKQFDSSVTMGTIVPVRPPYISFDPSVLHGTQAWQGTRLALIAYALEPTAPFAEGALRSLQGLGFGFSLDCQLLSLWYQHCWLGWSFIWLHLGNG